MSHTVAPGADARPVLDFSGGARSVDFLCGRHGPVFSQAEYDHAIAYIRGPDDLKTRVALHMMEQCVRHRAGKPTQPYELPRGVSDAAVRMLGEEGWLVCKPAILSWNRHMTVHKPGYC